MEELHFQYQPNSLSQPDFDEAGAEMRPQPHSEILADQRAYAFKSCYLNTIIEDSLLHPDSSDKLCLSENQLKKIRKKKADVESIIKSIDNYIGNETFEELIERKFKKFYDHSIHQIETALDIKVSDNPKAIGPTTSRAILGVKAMKIEEFEKANLQLKTIRLEYNGKLKESMVFDTIKYTELVSENSWEESTLYKTLTQRFLFVVFQKPSNKIEKEAILKTVFFWTMPTSDLLIARQVWEDTRNKVRSGIYDSFIKISDKMIYHVRPKARDSKDKTNTPQGFLAPKKAFWLNRDYVYSIVLKCGQPII